MHVEKEIPPEYRNEFISEFIHDVLQELGYNTSDLDIVQCLDLSLYNDYRCYWRDIVIIVTKDYSKLVIHKKKK